METIALKKGKNIFLKNVNYLTSIFEISYGMMFYKKGNYLLKALKESVAHSTIHTGLCRPLLVAWLDKKMKVVDVKQTKPWRMYKPKKPALYVLETTNLKTKIKIGDKLEIIK